ncbi:MAG: ATP cone domain-containing protein, partial [Planctomycetes bacterium]|nr:ATP cone domain-containing protein [Planctomycetota bacterium]
MKCPFCKKDNDRVVDSRVIGEGRSIRRRRKCLTCDKRFTTYERIEAAPRLVVKQDQRREHFNRDKILQALRLACKKRPISEEQLESIASRVVPFDLDKISDAIHRAQLAVGAGDRAYARELAEVVEHFLTAE